jgi:hypothetical protein
VDFGGLEAALQVDSLLLEAEDTCAWNHDAIGNGFSAPAGAALGDVFFYGWYAQALYFPTGEHRDYETKTGVFGRLIPHENFGHCGSPGAWQVGARYNVLNLVDSGNDGTPESRLDKARAPVRWIDHQGVADCICDCSDGCSDGSSEACSTSFALEDSAGTGETIWKNVSATASPTAFRLR